MRIKFNELLNKKIVVLDGSTGTMLQQQGLPSGVSPEIFCAENPKLISNIQLEYLAAGADIIYTPTFGANQIKLKHYGVDKQVVALNKKLAEISLKVAFSKRALVAGDIGATGLFFEPFGENSIEEGMAIYAQQIKALASAGVDLLVIETQLDIQEARLALLAAKEETKLPVVVCMTFEKTGRTLTGNDPITCLNILQSLGADGFGINCSTGPEAMLEIIKKINSYARIPLLVKPNAGLPIVKAGQTIFPMLPKEFASYAKDFIKQGVSMLGGCCGTTPGHIKYLAQQAKNKKRRIITPSKGLLLSSARKTVVVGRDLATPIKVVGERINPTGKKKLQLELEQGEINLVKNFAQEQQEQGADILDINVGMPGVDEQALMLKVLKSLSVISDLPVSIDSSNSEVIEKALRFYPGRVLVNSISGEKDKLSSLLPLIQKYGAAFILLPLDEKGIPKIIGKRKKILDKVVGKCERYNILREDIVVDGLVMTVSTNQANASLTLDTLEYASRILGTNTILGLSNISFGLPNRSLLNSTFLAMAASQGLSMVIANPQDELLMNIKYASDVLTSRDKGSEKFISNFSQTLNNKTKVKAKAKVLTPEESIRLDILKGEQEQIVKHLKTAIQKGKQPDKLVNKIMIPAIQEVGNKYEAKEYFLPQLVGAAETMEKGVNYLTPYLDQKDKVIKGKGILATVKGDVHDIGKNIVGLILRNNGYEIIDLGKSVDEKTIVDKAIEYKVDFIGLSALMTTTMLEMEKVVELVKQRKLKIKVILGGAVVNQKYAQSIGADAYASDAIKCIEILNKILNPVFSK